MTFVSWARNASDQTFIKCQCPSQQLLFMLVSNGCLASATCFAKMLSSMGSRLPYTLSFLHPFLLPLQEESCLAGHLGERAPRTVNEDGSTIFGDETAADVGTEDVAEAESGSEASSEQLTGQQEHVVTRFGCLLHYQ